MRPMRRATFAGEGRAFAHNRSVYFCRMAGKGTGFSNVRTQRFQLYLTTGSKPPAPLSTRFNNICEELNRKFFVISALQGLYLTKRTYR
jgi:hypothetical protein